MITIWSLLEFFPIEGPIMNVSRTGKEHSRENCSQRLGVLELVSIGGTIKSVNVWDEALRSDSRVFEANWNAFGQVVPYMDVASQPITE